MRKVRRDLLRLDRERMRIPRSARDAVPVRRVWEDGIFRTGDLYSRTWQFDDFFGRLIVIRRQHA